MRIYRTAPHVEFIRSNRNGNTLKLLRHITYRVGSKTITVPKGFCCDGMSVPRILWSIISPMIASDTVGASIFHDWVYRTHPAGWTRKQADVVFYFIMRTDGVALWRAALAYLGVRLGGKQSWNNGGSTK